MWLAESEDALHGRWEDVCDGAWRGQPGFSQVGAMRTTYPEYDGDELKESRSLGIATRLLRSAKGGIAAALE